MSIDPAHSLGDSFDLETDLFHLQTSDPLQVGDRLWIQELNIQKEIKRHWQEISSYVTSVLRTTGISGVEAEELAILPGMEELSAMMYVNQYRREQDEIVLRAPTAEGGPSTTCALPSYTDSQVWRTDSRLLWSAAAARANVSSHTALAYTLPEDHEGFPTWSACRLDVKKVFLAIL
jgi:hypothetical protein